MILIISCSDDHQINVQKVEGDQAEVDKTLINVLNQPDIQTSEDLQKHKNLHWISPNEAHLDLGGPDDIYIMIYPV